MAIIILILFQLKWMQQSRDLLEEQFDQKVKMALCSAVEGLADGSCSDLFSQTTSLCSHESPYSCQDRFQALSRDPQFERRLQSSLSFYGIDLDYEFRIADQAPPPAFSNTAYSCSLNPLPNSNTHSLYVQFTGKEKYILKRMGFMIIASILILLFIGGVFVVANRYLLRQERIGALNIEFFNHMAHEFRTPLTNIQLANRLLQKQAKIPKHNRFLEIIQRESAQLQQQLESVLQLARMEESEYHLKKEPIRVEDLLRGVMEEMKLQAQERNGEIRLESPDHSIHCLADRLHMHNAFRNLVDNALKYCGPAPRLDISVHDGAAEVIVRFKDNGPGISPVQQSLIFEPFHRLSHCDRKGFGLGLPYVKKVIDLHHGRLQITSPDASGATFEVFLPKKIA